MSALHQPFLTAIVAGDFPAALAVAQQAHARGLVFLYEEVIAPALAEVGRLWQAGRLTVADEHVASAVAQSVLATFYASFPWTPSGPTGVVGCVAGERHALGARMAADLLANDGWNIMFVGADVPVDALVDLVVRERPVFVGLSVAMPEHAATARAMVERLRRDAPGCRILVGGRAVASDAISALDADAMARTAASAVDIVRSWKR